jgi:hypothetical protein
MSRSPTTTFFLTRVICVYFEGFDLPERNSPKTAPSPRDRSRRKLKHDNKHSGPVNKQTSKKIRLKSNCIGDVIAKYDVIDEAKPSKEFKNYFFNNSLCMYHCPKYSMQNTHINSLGQR